MKIAYLVFAYRNANFLKKEIDVLSTPDCTFFIHIDQKSSLRDFASIEGSNVVFSSRRLPVYWAEYSGVQAILLLLRQALGSREVYDYFVLLSGSGYPLRSGRSIGNFLQQHHGEEFISMVKVPNREAGKPLSRINTLMFESGKPIRRFGFKVLAKSGLLERDYRNYLSGMEPYSGNTWWALTREACQYLVEFLDNNPRVPKFFTNVFAPEEVIFHTVLGNSSFRPQVRRNLVYEDWSLQESHPAMIDETHVAFFESRQDVPLNDIYGAGVALFARKFSDASMHLLPRIDAMMIQREHS